MIALAIRLDSAGPAFFRQRRHGFNNEEFVVYKFRTMRTPDSQPDIRQARRDDPRVTRVGRLLRHTSLDELPQLWNVFWGDMSLVGPRPPIPTEVSQYSPSDRRRLSMRPGITCTWQVSGRSLIGFAEWVKLDLEYIENWSLRRDVKLLMRTIPAVVRGTGAE